MAIISLAVPLVLWAIRWLLGRAWPTAGTGLQVTIIAVCAAAVASHALAITLALPTPLHVAAVILVGLDGRLGVRGIRGERAGVRRRSQ